LLSAGSLVFSGVAGGAQLPAAQSVQVLSGAAGATVSWSASISPAVPWLSLSQASGTAPGAFSVTPTGQALSLAASSTPYQTAIVVACAAPLACSQTLSVSLTVSSPAPVLTSSAVVLSFAGSAAAPPQQQTLTLGNAGGGTIGFASIASPAPWVVVGPNPGSISAGQQTGIAVSVNAGGLAPGYYRSAVNVSSSAGVTSVPVTLFLTPQPSMALSAAGTQFAFSSGGAPAAVNHSFLISTTAASPIAWTASVSSGGAWLSTSTPSGSASASAPGVVSFSLDPAASAQLAPGGYYGTIRIASSAVVDSPLDFQVVLNVGPSSAAAAPVPSPEGLVFLTTAATQPAAQSVQVFSTGSGAANFQTSAITGDGHSWLSASPASFGTLPGAAAQSQISVNPAGLSPGVYYGTVNYAGPAATVRGVNVTMIVLPPGSSPCTPAQAIPVPLSLLNGFAATVSRPTPVAIMLLNDCGMPMTNGVATATFSDGETPLTLAPAIGAAGLYTATWYPRQPAAQASISLLAAAPGLAAAPVLLNGIVRPGNAPALAPLSTLHIFAPQPGAAVAPGNIVQIYGSNLASSTASASGVPLATTLGGTSVSFGGIPAPLFYVSPSQINAQVPFELGSEGQYQIEVNSNGIQSPPDVVHVSATAPGIAALPSGIAIAQHSDGSLVSEQSPAKPGESLVLYASGLGVTNPAVASGAASPSSPLAVPQAMPTLLIGAESALIRFVGLTPGLVGLYQINMTVPPDVPNGDLPLVLSQGAGNSVAVILPVHN
jgi:uncharacterized protein (TIGR03437 family)